METVQLGRSGLHVSRIALGMMSYGDPAEESWFLDEDAARPIVRAAVEAGVTFFDTADMYSTGRSEEITGRLLRESFRRRSDYVIGTKVYFPMGEGPNDRGLSRQHILNAVDASLARLGSDYIDLYQLHRWDDTTPVDETVGALADIVRAGKVRYVGASLMRAWQFAELQHAADEVGLRFVAMQTRYNLGYREEEREMLPYCRHTGTGVLAYSPLARGSLVRTDPASIRATGEGERFVADADPETVERLRTTAAGIGMRPAALALAWLLSKPGVSAPIVGATRLEHIADAVTAAEEQLDPSVVAALDAGYRVREPSGYEPVARPASPPLSPSGTR
jgi:aryl-alcohol dehydrogenase-like predicted oxidoreductase